MALIWAQLIAALGSSNMGKNIACCLKITEKVSFKIASEASYVYILRGQKYVKSAKNGQFIRYFRVVFKHREVCSFGYWISFIAKLKSSLMIKETEPHLRTLLSMIPSVWLEMQPKIKWRWTPQTPFLVSPECSWSGYAPSHILA